MGNQIDMDSLKVSTISTSLGLVYYTDIASDEFADKIATKINEKINIPFVSEEKEQLLFEKVVDVVTDLMEGVFRGK